MNVYPLVNCYIAMENHNFVAGKIHYFDWAIFNSYFDITRGYILFSGGQEMGLSSPISGSSKIFDAQKLDYCRRHHHQVNIPTYQHTNIPTYYHTIIIPSLFKQSGDGIFLSF